MKIKVISIINAFIIILSIYMPVVLAANTSTLPKDVLIRTNGFDINRTTKVEEIKKVFGNAILETVKRDV